MCLFFLSQVPKRRASDVLAGSYAQNFADFFAPCVIAIRAYTFIIMKREYLQIYELNWMVEQLLRIEEEGKIHLTNKVTVCKEEKLLCKRMAWMCVRNVIIIIVSREIGLRFRLARKDL